MYSGTEVVYWKVNEKDLEMLKGTLKYYDEAMNVVSYLMWMTKMDAAKWLSAEGMIKISGMPNTAYSKSVLIRTVREILNNGYCTDICNNPGEGYRLVDCGSFSVMEKVKSFKRAVGHLESADKRKKFDDFIKKTSPDPVAAINEKLTTSIETLLPSMKAVADKAHKELKQHIDDDSILVVASPARIENEKYMLESGKKTSAKRK